MATTTTPEFIHPPDASGKRSQLGSIVASVLGSFAGLLALAGIALILVHAVARDDGGFYSTDDERLTTSTYALTSETIDTEIGDSIPVGAVGTLRVSAEPRDGKPVFVGIARQDDVDAYLRGVAHEQVGGDFPDGSPDYARRDGGAPAGLPAGQYIWAASAQGAGRQHVDWDIRDGKWAAVVMNADAGRGVEVDASAGAKLDWLLPLGIVLAGIGTAGAAIAGASIVALNRRIRA